MARPIRLVFDAHAIAPQRSGIGDYSYYLVRALLEYHRADVALSLFANGRIVRVESMEEVDAATAEIQPGALYSMRNQRILPKLLKGGDYDLLHTPDYTIPLLNRSVPMVATIHDIVPMVYSRLMNKSKKAKLLWMYKWYLRQTMKRCRAVITVSEFSRNEILAHLRCPPPKVFAIHNGRYLLPVERYTGADAVPGLPEGKYFLFVGRQEPYKGIRQLMEAFASVKDELAPEVTKLVFIGTVDTRYPWQKISADLGLQEDILFTGYITLRQLSWAYKHAAGLVFPSLYEGFGVPPLDAMEHGTPVAASNRASVPEVAADAALIFDPENHDEFRDALLRLALNRNLREELIGKGRRRIHDFSWELTAGKTVEVYRKAVHR